MATSDLTPIAAGWWRDVRWRLSCRRDPASTQPPLGDRWPFPLAQASGCFLAPGILSNFQVPFDLAISVPSAVSSTVVVVFTQIESPVAVVASPLDLPPMRWIGESSHGLSTWHYSIYVAILTVPFVAHHSLTYGGAPCLAATLLLADASHRFVEQPVVGRWKVHLQRTEALPMARPAQ